MKPNYIQLTTIKPSGMRFIDFILGSCIAAAGFSMIISSFFAAILCILYGLGMIASGAFNNKLFWNLKSPKNNKFSLFKVGEEYVAAESEQEAILWATLSESQSEVEFVGMVNQFER